MKHAHSHEHCDHPRLRYCKECRLVHCLDCKLEWSAVPLYSLTSRPWSQYGSQTATYTYTPRVNEVLCGSGSGGGASSSVSATVTANAALCSHASTP